MSTTKHRIIAIVALAIAAAAFYFFGNLPVYSETAKNVLNGLGWLCVALAVFGTVMTAFHAWQGRSRRS